MAGGNRVTNPHAEADAFERWLSEKHCLSSEWQPERNCYRDFQAHLAWRAWLASRERALSQRSTVEPGASHE